MGFVYKITNILNNKVYIGITKYKNPKMRFYKHVSEHKTSGNYTKRPLYEAMKKYGVTNFIFDVIEETSNEKLTDREIFWIKHCRSYVGFKNSNGYNATLGGDGGHKVISKEDEQIIIDLYLKGYGMKYIVKTTHHTYKTIKICLENNNIKINSVTSKIKVIQMDKDFNIINEFPSIVAANKYLNKTKHDSKINEVCKGKRKTAYGYYWKLLS